MGITLDQLQSVQKIAKDFINENLTETERKLVSAIQTLYDLLMTRNDNPLKGLEGSTQIQDTPVGTIISYLGNTPPPHYLACDGTTYNIIDFPDLANHIETEFGSCNHYGGDGIATFAVPDLRGEFLRCAGKYNSIVGVHQEPTNHLNINLGTAENLWIDSDKGMNMTNDDKKIHINETNPHTVYWNKSGKNNDNITRGDFGTYYTSRPTNTGVLFCIKSEATANLHIEPSIGIYSEEEVYIGLYKNEKLYRRMIVVPGYITSTRITIPVNHIDIKEMIFIEPRLTDKSWVINNYSLTNQEVDTYYSHKDKSIIMNVHSSYVTNGKVELTLFITYTKN